MADRAAAQVFAGPGAWHFAQLPFISNAAPPAWWQVRQPSLDLSGTFADRVQSLSWQVLQPFFARFACAA